MIKDDNIIIVCLCGSSRWPSLHFKVMMHLTLEGKIVIPMGLYGHADFPQGSCKITNDGNESNEVKKMLDKLHYKKIDLSDEIFVVDLDNNGNVYIGNSTKREIEYALKNKKIIHYLSNFDW